MFGRVLTLIVLAAAIALGIMLQSTNPSAIGAGGILVVFFLLYIISVGLCTWIIYVVSHVMAVITQTMFVKYRFNSLTATQAYYYGSVVGLGVVMLIALQSVSTLKLYDYLLVLVFEAIAIFYIKKRTQ